MRMTRYHCIQIRLPETKNKKKGTALNTDKNVGQQEHSFVADEKPFWKKVAASYKPEFQQFSAAGG